MLHKCFDGFDIQPMYMDMFSQLNCVSWWKIPIHEMIAKLLFWVFNMYETLVLQLFIPIGCLCPWIAFSNNGYHSDMHLLESYISPAVTYTSRTQINVYSRDLVSSPFMVAVTTCVPSTCVPSEFTSQFVLVWSASNSITRDLSWVVEFCFHEDKPWVSVWDFRILRKVNNPSFVSSSAYCE